MRISPLALLAPFVIAALVAATPLPFPAPTHPPRYLSSLGLPIPTAPGSWSVALDQGGGMLPLVRKFSLDSTGHGQLAREEWGPTPSPVQIKLEAPALATIATAIQSARISAWFYDDATVATEIHPQFNAGDDADRYASYIPPPHPLPRGYYDLTVARRSADGTIETGQAYWQAGGPTTEPSDAIGLADAIAKAFKAFAR